MKRLLTILSGLFITIAAFAQYWSLNGNMYTGGSAFLGTVDAYPLVFKVNNQLSGYTGYSGNSNVSFGYRSLINAMSYNTGQDNVAVGFEALSPNTDGAINTAVGAYSLKSNTSGFGNTAIGSYSLKSNTSGYDNIAIGVNSLYSNIWGSENTAIGVNSLYSNTTGRYNTATGSYALYGNLTGEYNTATGAASLSSNTTGYENTANGFYALLSNMTGYDNTANGAYALFSNTTGYENTATGVYALNNNTTGYENTAVGAYALNNNTTGYENTATGYQSLFANVGSYNTANGYKSLYFNTTGYVNVAIGDQALYRNTTGSYNTATGSYALGSNSTGQYNTAFGCQALVYSNAWYNTAVGHSALDWNSDGSGNTAVGCEALHYNATGSNNTSIGFAAGVISTAFNANNTTTVGYDAKATGSNQVRIGNGSVTSIGGNANWTNLSDRRAKKNIQTDVPGLAFINRLQPVTYNLDLDAMDDLLKIDKTGKNGRDTLMQQMPQEWKDMEKKAREAKQKQVQTGFIAQDVEKMAKSIGYDFSGVDVDELGIYGLRYAEFVVPLVKAVQELSEQSDAKDATIASMQEQIKELTGLVYQLLGKTDEPSMLKSGDASATGLSELSDSDLASLQQNIPNPFNQSTTIYYTLPKTCNSALIVITNTGGGVIRQIPVSGFGTGSITVEGGSLQAGIYYYSLYVDNALIDTKRMLLTEK